MSRTIYLTASTLNGFLADENDSLAWLFAVPGGDSGGESFDRFLDGVGVLVQGSSTYAWVLAHEDLVAHPEKWPAYYGDRPTFVFTHRALPLVPGADIRFVSGSVAAHWEAIRDAADGRDIWVVGGGDLAGQFLDAGHLDEIVVTFAPAALVAGKPLLPRDLGADRLTLIEVEQRGPFAEVRYRVSAP